MITNAWTAQEQYALRHRSDDGEGKITFIKCTVGLLVFHSIYSYEASDWTYCSQNFHHKLSLQRASR